MRIKMILESQKRTVFLSLIILAFFTVFNTAATFALNKKYDKEFFSKNSILIYNPEDTCSESGGSISELSGDDNRKKIWNYLTARGLSPEQTAGVLGNIKAKSNETYSPTVNESTQSFPEGGYGIGQWSGTRREALIAHLTASHPDLMEKYYSVDYSSEGAYTGESDGFVPKNKTTGELMSVEDNDKLLISELEFLVSESLSRNLQTPAIGKGYGTDNDKEWTILLKQTTVDDASNIWVYSFEVPDEIETTSAARAKNGQEMFELYGTGETNGGCGSANGNKKQLAAEILATNNLYYDPGVGTEERALLPNIAAGTNNGNDWPCGMNINILKGLAAIAKEHRIRANSLNRACSNDIPEGSSKNSWHYAGNGSAIDFGPIDGLSSYSTAGANMIMQYMGPFMVDGSGVGQRTGSNGEACLGDSLQLPAGVAINYFADFCNHLHVEVPPDSDPELKCKQGNKGRCVEPNITPADVAP